VKKLCRHLASVRLQVLQQRETNTIINRSYAKKETTPGKPEAISFCRLFFRLAVLVFFRAFGNGDAAGFAFFFSLVLTSANETAGDRIL